MFDYSLDFKQIDFRRHPELYRIGRGEQGVLLVEPYKGELLPHGRFRTVAEAKRSQDCRGGPHMEVCLPVSPDRPETGGQDPFRACTHFGTIEIPFRVLQPCLGGTSLTFVPSC